MGESGEKKSLSRSLGEFFGHIWKGVQEPVENKMVVRQESHKEVRQTPEGTVVVRRTVVEEMELRPKEKPPEG